MPFFPYAERGHSPTTATKRARIEYPSSRRNECNVVFPSSSNFSFSPVAYHVPAADDVTVQNDRGLVGLKIFDVVSDNTQVAIRSYEVNEIGTDGFGIIRADYTPRPFQATSGSAWFLSSWHTTIGV